MHSRSRLLCIRLANRISLVLFSFSANITQCFLVFRSIRLSSSCFLCSSLSILLLGFILLSSSCCRLNPPEYSKTEMERTNFPDYLWDCKCFYVVVARIYGNLIFICGAIMWPRHKMILLKSASVIPHKRSIKTSLEWKHTPKCCRFDKFVGIHFFSIATIRRFLFIHSSRNCSRWRNLSSWIFVAGSFSYSVRDFFIIVIALNSFAC